MARPGVRATLLVLLVGLATAHKSLKADSNLQDAPGTCHEQNSAKHCARVPFCDWCSATAVPSGCYHSSETPELAKGGPPRIPARSIHHAPL